MRGDIIQFFKLSEKIDYFKSFLYRSFFVFHYVTFIPIMSLYMNLVLGASSYHASLLAVGYSYYYY